MASDADLVRLAAAGDLPAMEILFNDHKSMVFAVGLSVCGNAPDADEVVQETFLRAFRSLDDWRGDAKFSTWVYSIAMRVSLNWKSRFNRPVPLRAEAAADPTDSDLERDEQIAALTRAIGQLPLQQRLVVTLKHMKGLSVAQIAEIQQCAVGTVKSNLHHGVAKLKDLLERTAP
jgi:RNA polymerase sigma-70 factor (ECF subfamily)